MRIALLLAAPLFLVSCVAAEAHGDRWEPRSRPSFYELKRACDWGDREACVRMGQRIERRRHAERDRWEQPPPPPPPPYGWGRRGW